MSEIRLGATVTEKGGLKPDAPTIWAALLSKLAGKRVVVTIQPEATRRSSQANARYWSCIVPVFQQIWSEARVKAGLPGYTREEVHEVLVQVLVGCEDGPLPGSRVRVRTSTMSKEQFQAFTKAAEDLLWQQYRVPVPDGDWQAVEA